MPHFSLEKKAALNFLRRRVPRATERKVSVAHDLRIAWCDLSYSYCQTWLASVRKGLHLCRCGELGGEFRMPTQYHKPEQNYIFCCPDCARDAQEYYLDLWSNLDGGCPPATQIASEISRHRLPHAKRACLTAYVKFARFACGAFQLIAFPLGAALSWLVFWYYVLRLRAAV